MHLFMKLSNKDQETRPISPEHSILGTSIQNSKILGNIDGHSVSVQRQTSENGSKCIVLEIQEVPNHRRRMRIPIGGLSSEKNLKENLEGLSIVSSKSERTRSRSTEKLDFGRYSPIRRKKFHSSISYFHNSLFESHIRFIYLVSPKIISLK